MHANRPIVGGYSADGRPSSTIFYWSHSVFSDDFEFGLHPHEGFEIATFVLEGASSHYDTANKLWVALTAGDVQVIRAGRGIAHNERVAKRTRAFQLWFDPDYHTALKREPSYSDYGAEQFSARTDGHSSIRDLIGGSGPVRVETERLTVRRAAMGRSGRLELPLAVNAYSVAYVIAGDATIAGHRVVANDAVTVAGGASLSMDATSAIDIFVVSVPAVPSYQPVRRRR